MTDKIVKRIVDVILQNSDPLYSPDYFSDLHEKFMPEVKYEDFEKEMHKHLEKYGIEIEIDDDLEYFAYFPSEELF